MPNQLDKQTAEVLESAGLATVGTVATTVVINIFLSFLKGASLNTMISSIKSMQIIVHLCLMLNLLVPPNAQVFIDELFNMIKFDPVDPEELGFDFDLIPIPFQDDEDEDDEEDED